MKLPPLLSSRSPAEQIVVANVVPCVFGAITGIALGLHEIAYLLLAGPIGILGGYFAGLEHRSGPEGAARGALGGVQFGAMILGVHELSGMDAEAHLPHPAILLVVLTTGIGAVLGFFGGLTRERRMRKEVAAAGNH
ncbi:MAG TPA: hypothetical protein VNB64_07820 [Solirubrobacteraceae bacterium]|nr:hypothetical protein [Solirubrobacteraceae bacterium]